MRPLIAIPCDIRQLGAHPFHAVGDKYIRGVTEGAGGMPWLVPALGDGAWLDEVVDRIDGVMLTGSPSNIEPFHYNGTPSRAGTLHDPARDSTTLPLIRRLLQRGVPILGICRGFQEINVAFGGTLYQHVQEEQGMLDHRESPDDPVEAQYAPAHRVTFAEGGLLARLTGQQEARVNSLHQQGVRELAPGLRAEALADDGLIEAFSVSGAGQFAFAVQWHPEWRCTDNPVSMAIFGAFGEACRAYQNARRA